MKNVNLVILAAGLGSRFKEGLKQLAKVGPNNETIMELSIKDAKEIGYNKVIFIIREALKEDFDKYVIPNIDIEYEYVYQKMDDIPVKVDINRTKPWGTGHALLSLRNTVKDDFVIINADDYYGKAALMQMYNFLRENDTDTAMVGYSLENTVFIEEPVNRGVCIVANGMLKDIKETYAIRKIGDIFSNDEVTLDGNTLVSMNIWAFRTDVFESFEREFVKFLNNEELEKAEFLIPKTVNTLIKQNNMNVKVIPSTAKCIGITYTEDVRFFKEAL